MESQTLDEKIEWEARRVAAAFEVKEWEGSCTVPGKATSSSMFFEGGTETDWVEWAVMRRNAQLMDISYGHRTREQEVCSLMSDWTRPCICVPNAQYNERMVRGLYRLGMPDEVLAQFNRSLSTHEKLELLLSMPREFWPPKWLAE